MAVIAVAAHLLSIAELPRGLYAGECSIGYNARLIATVGRDEHDVPFPLFFKAFGEDKNPVYIYLMAVVYRMIGFSVWSTRFTSFLCWFAGTACVYALGRRIWRDLGVRLYLLVCLAFTPW